MAIITGVFRSISRGVIEASWIGLTSSDEGALFDAALYSDKCVHVFGTFVSGQVAIQGGNATDSLLTLTDPQGNALVFTTSGIEQIMENPRYIRPLSSSGDVGTEITVIIVGRGGQP